MKSEELEEEEDKMHISASGKEVLSKDERHLFTTWL